MQEEILSVINQWNEKSLAALYRNFYKVTVSYAYKIVKEQMIAEDVVQDVFLSMWENKRLSTHLDICELSLSNAFTIDVLTNYATIRILSIESKKCFI